MVLHNKPGMYLSSQDVDDGKYSGTGFYFCYVCDEWKDSYDFISEDFFYKGKVVHVCKDCAKDVDLSSIRLSYETALQDENVYALISKYQRSYRQIYFIKDLDRNWIKIGVTRDYRKRFSQIRSANTNQLQLLLVITANPRLEKLLHQMFHKWRRQGEWFASNKALNKTINEIYKVADNYNHVVFKNPAGF